jgi:hypothetical protein
MKRLRPLFLVAAAVALAVTGLAAYRSSSFEMTTQATNPIASGVGGLYTKTADGIPRLVDTARNEYPAGEAKRITPYAGTPGSVVLSDCWTDSTNGYRLYCKESGGNLPQRFDGTVPGPIGCGGTPSTGCFTAVTIAGAPAEAVFSRTCTLTSAAAATPVNCLADADVPTGKAVHLLGWHAKVNGATAWATTASCYIADTSGAGGTGLIFVTAAVAALTGNAFVSDASANVTQGSVYALNTGGTTAKGLQIACDGKDM